MLSEKSPIYSHITINSRIVNAPTIGCGRSLLYGYRCLAIPSDKQQGCDYTFFVCLKTKSAMGIFNLFSKKFILSICLALFPLIIKCQTTRFHIWCSCPLSATTMQPLDNLRQENFTITMRKNVLYLRDDNFFNLYNKTTIPDGFITTYRFEALDKHMQKCTILISKDDSDEQMKWPILIAYKGKKTAMMYISHEPES